MAFNQFEFFGTMKKAHLSKIIHGDDIMNRLLKWSKNPQNILFFSGLPGNGKSYFASAWFNSLKENQKNVRCYNEFALFEELKRCINLPDNPPDYRAQVIAETDNLIIDDLGSTLSLDKDKSEWKKSLLFNIIDFRYNNDLPTLVTSNLFKDDLNNIFQHERFTSRIYAAKNTIIEMREPDRRTILNFGE